MAAINYAKEYSDVLAQKFPYVLYFGALYSTPNNNRYRWLNAKTIEIPTLKTTGRVNADRDTITSAKRNYDNAWEPKTLSNQRMWSTLVHPADIDQTNHVASIANITQTYNEEQKFPEMDAYTISKIYTDWITTHNPDDAAQNLRTADTTALTVDNILSVFDTLTLNMDNERVPGAGRILYVTNEVDRILKEAQGLSRTFNVQNNNAKISRAVKNLDDVDIVPVPSTLMKTAYNFTEGWASAEGASQINMMLVHPTSVITPVSFVTGQIRLLRRKF